MLSIPVSTAEGTGSVLDGRTKIQNVTGAAKKKKKKKDTFIFMNFL